MKGRQGVLVLFIAFGFWIGTEEGFSASKQRFNE